MPPPPRVRRRRAAPRPADDRWLEILERTAEIFAAKGYERTTVRDIADALGLLSGSLYYYISTKEDLLFAIIEAFHARGREAMAALDEAAGPDPLATLRAVVVRHVELNAETPVETAVFHTEFRRLAPERQEGITRTRRDHEDRVTRLVERGQADGALRADVPARVAALSALAMLNATHTWFQPGRGLTATELGELQATLLLDGLRAR
ncbi:TetR/AcrR family transcriptional regulator [Pseudonocardia pini]|uniref:TetR/AcrR family transcriptional regulator n=1 Tax=Pseudonocardia pini TaxID=2758030 RepID=UPI0015F06E6A|nr:TetR/AcrR family transcriptional regulator [Pseudonocardia pini]